MTTTMRSSADYIGADLRKNRLIASDARTPQASANLLLSFWLCGVVLVLFLLTSEQLRHWFVVPVFCCGVAVGKDAVAWARGQIGTFDPVGIVGLLGVHFFFLAPLLHIAWDHWNRFRLPPQDWRPWLGWMAMLNLLGLCAYFFGRHLMSKPNMGRANSTWVLRPRTFGRLLIVALVITGLIQIYVYASYGGLVGYIDAIHGESFQDMGFIFMVAESFPILALMGYAALAKDNPRWRTWGFVILALVLFTGLKLLFGGLRGSRGNTVWGLFWAVGIVQMWIRPIPRKLYPVGIIALFVFMYLYGFFERGGLDVYTQARSESGTTAIERQIDSPAKVTALGDLARTDIQAYILYRLNTDSEPFPEKALGRTYLGAATLLIPNPLYLGTKPPTKLLEGSELVEGPGAYAAGNLSSRVYGLSGEAMLNFGAWAVPIAFLVWGLFTGAVSRWMRGWKPMDSRWLLAPLVVNLLFVLLVNDSDNVVFFLVKNGAVPILIVFMSSYRYFGPVESGATTR